MLGGGRRGVLEQQVHAPGRLGERHPARLEQLQQGLDQAKVVRSARPGGQRRASEGGVFQEHRGVGGEHPLQPLRPAAPGRCRADRAEQFVQDGRVQFVGVADVHVERGRAGVEFLREPSHRHLAEPFRPQDRDGGGDDALPGQGGLGGTLPAGAGGSVHAITVTNMFVANKFETNMFVKRCTDALFVER